MTILAFILGVLALIFFLLLILCAGLIKDMLNRLEERRKQHNQLIELIFEVPEARDLLLQRNKEERQ